MGFRNHGISDNGRAGETDDEVKVRNIQEKQFRIIIAQEWTRKFPSCEVLNRSIFPQTFLFAYYSVRHRIPVFFTSALALALTLISCSSYFLSLYIQYITASQPLWRILWTHNPHVLAVLVGLICVAGFILSEHRTTRKPWRGTVMHVHPSCTGLLNIMFVHH